MFNLLNKFLKCPKIYMPSAYNFWQDEYISKKLLEVHLNPQIELASRNPDFIESSVRWIIETVPQVHNPKLLDLGCGPGIYAEKFARAGYKVTGVDFSRRSIDYARRAATLHDLPITYFHQNYLDLKLEDMFDLAVMIYCDYGALSDENREILMGKVYERLKPGGKFLLDVCSVKEYEDFKESRTWEFVEADGFWSPEKYFCFNINQKYQDMTTLTQAVVITQTGTNVYYIWNHCFTENSLIAEANNAGFQLVERYSDVSGQPYSKESKTIAVLLIK